MIRTAYHAPDARPGGGAPAASLRATPVRNAFVYPALGGPLDLGYLRIGGGGLCNLLLIWARSLVAADRLDIPMLAPAWPSVKIGPILRGEADRRFYVGLFRAEQGVRHGLPKMLAFAGVRCVERFVLPSELGSARSRTLYIPDPDRIAPYYFDELFHCRAHIAERLIAMTRPFHIQRVRALPRPCVAVHIRMGDFAPATDGPLRSVNTRLPLDWFADRMEALRRELGPGARFSIFSDGHRHELASLLRAPDVELRSGGSAIVDLLSMTRASALIASASTFSLWASFLGRMPSLWYPGGMLQAFPDAHSLRIESAAGDPIDPRFAAAYAAVVDLLAPPGEEGLS